MYFSKQFYKKGLALSAKHGFNPPPPPHLSFQFTYSSMGVTGVFMIRNFVICVKVTLQRCHGVLLIGNFGFARKISIILHGLQKI